LLRKYEKHGLNYVTIIINKLLVSYPIEFTVCTQAYMDSTIPYSNQVVSQAIKNAMSVNLSVCPSVRLMSLQSVTTVSAPFAGNFYAEEKTPRKKRRKPNRLRITYS